MKPQKALTSLTGYIEGCFQNLSLQHQHLSGAGTTFLLEEKLRNHFNKKFALTFTSATTALQAVCLSLELQNAEILTSPVGWGGSISPFLLHRNKIRFSSIDPDSLNINVNDLDYAITTKTKAILSVDFNGTPANSEDIKKICAANNLHYISDSSQSLGANQNKKPPGFFADIIVLSFSPGKSCFAGEGGAIVTDDESVYEKLLLNSMHPSKQKAVLGISNYNEYAPLNGRMNPLSAILLNATFESSLAELKKYQHKCFQLLKDLNKEKMIAATPHINSPAASTFFNFSMQLKSNATLRHVNEFLKNGNYPFTAIQSSVKWIPYDIKFRKQFKGKFSCSENLQNQKSLIQFNDRITLIHSAKTNQI